MKRLAAGIVGIVLSFMLIAPVFATQAGSGNTNSRQTQGGTKDSGKKFKSGRNRGASRLFREKAKEEIAREKAKRQQLIEQGGTGSTTSTTK